MRPLPPRLLFLGLLAALALTACGQKGDLYLPDKASAIETAPASTATG
jgi:predicted small lipoprotein YifL